MDSSPLQLFKEISQMNKEFRYSILHSMPKEYRFDVGAEILKLVERVLCSNNSCVTRLPTLLKKNYYLFTL